MAVTPLDIANQALALLTEAPIDSLDDDDRAARLLNTHFDTTREAELLKRDWVFAILSSNIDPAETGVSPYGYSYALPSDCLRLLPLTWNGDPDADEIDYRRENDTVLTTYGGARNIRYIGNLVDPGDWDALFTQVFAAALAIKVAHALTGKAAMIDVARQAYADAVRDAIRVNAIQKRGRETRGTWAQARGDYQGYGYGGGW
jgi:hypothetical protein